ncbi:Ig-like domain-containing protein [Halovivax limisalsi]|uniref:Ig-like domain-containing protein n=1 Tax=Halovivax limisalsi TaxID=1453760 RepID=UPI001FFC4687|nr:Ig-like domain-containing protein [Halovivax limisalsi]
MIALRSITVLGAVLVCTGGLLLTGLLPLHAVTGSDDPDESTIPPDGPDYGVNSSDFYRLWSGDVDNRSVSEGDFEDGDLPPRERGQRALTRSTDIPFATPPQAAEQWTRGDLGDYESGGSSASIAPPNAELTNGPYIKDAFVSIAAVQPSTILHESNSTDTVQYIAPDGEVLAVSNFRVGLPEGNESDRKREDWFVGEAQVEQVTLEADGETLITDEGHRSILEYSDLSGSVTFEVEARITAEVDEVTGICSDWNATAERCEAWDSFERTISVEQTVSDTQSVEVNQLSNITGSRVAFDSDDDLVGAAVHPDSEWATIAVDSDVEARSSWWFYAAGTPGWQDMVTHKADGSTTSPSSFRPVQVHAFPSESEPYVPTERVNGTVPLRIEEVWGEERTGPELPGVIDLETADPYTNADSVALTSSVLEADALQEVTVTGIVRGQSETVTLGEPQTVREANLSLSFPEEDSTQATIRAEVLDANSGNPVSTGTVAIGNQSAPLDENGMATITITNPGPTVTAEYVPETWWQAGQLYASTETTAVVPGEFPDLRSLLQLLVVTLLWFLPVGLLALGLDYVTDGELLGLERSS